MGTGATFTGSVGTLGVIDLNDANFDRTPCGASYTFAGKFDPHGLGLYAGLDNGQRGLIVDWSNSCAALIDRAGMVAAARLSSDPNSIDTSPAAVRAFVKFVKLN